MGQFIVFAVLAPLIRSVELEEYQGGLILSCSSVVYALSSGVWGRLSSLLGRRRVMLIGLLGYSLGTLLFALTFYLGQLGLIGGTALFITLVISRMLQSTLMGATIPAAIAYMSDITETQQRVKGMGLVASANSIGSLLGPAVAAPLLAFNLLAPLLAGAITTAITALLIWLFLPLSQQLLEVRPVAIFQEIKNTLASFFDARYASLLLVGVLIFMGYAISQQTMGYLIQDRLLLTPQGAAQILAQSFVYSAAAALFTQLIIVSRCKLSPFTLLFCGLPLMALGYAWIIHLSAPIHSHVAFALIGMGMGMALPGFSASASLAVDAREQGAVAGVIAGAPALGFVMGPTVGAFLYQYSITLPYWFSSLLALFLIGLVFRLYHLTHRP